MVVINTQRILGNLLKESEVSKNQKNSFHGREDEPRKLSDYGLTKDQSSTFQKIARFLCTILCKPEKGVLM